MTAESLIKAREKRAENAAARLVQARNDIEAFRAWLAQEREAFQLRNHYAETTGRDSDNFMLTDILWRECWKNQPDAPPDWMWRVIRGEQPQEEAA